MRNIIDEVFEKHGDYYDEGMLKQFPEFREAITAAYFGGRKQREEEIIEQLREISKSTQSVEILEAIDYLIGSWQELEPVPDGIDRKEKS